MMVDKREYRLRCSGKGCKADARHERDGRYLCDEHEAQQFSVVLGVSALQVYERVDGDPHPLLSELGINACPRVYER